MPAWAEPHEHPSQGCRPGADCTGPSVHGVTIELHAKRLRLFGLSDQGWVSPRATVMPRLLRAFPEYKRATLGLLPPRPHLRASANALRVRGLATRRGLTHAFLDARQAGWDDRSGSARTRVWVLAE